MLREKQTKLHVTLKVGSQTQQNASVTEFAYTTNQGLAPNPIMTTKRLVVTHLYAVRVVSFRFFALNDAK